MSRILDIIAELQRIDKVFDCDDRVMTCSEAAFRLKKSNNTITRYIAAGKLHKASGNGVIGVKASEVYGLILKQE